MASTPWLYNEPHWKNISGKVANARSQFLGDMAGSYEKIRTPMVDERREAATVFTPKAIKSFIASQQARLDGNVFDPKELQAKAAFEVKAIQADIDAQEVLAPLFTQAKNEVEIFGTHIPFKDLQKSIVDTLTPTEMFGEGEFRAPGNSQHIKSNLAMAQAEIQNWAPGSRFNRTARFVAFATKVLDERSQSVDRAADFTDVAMEQAVEHKSHVDKMQNPAQQMAEATHGIKAGERALSAVRRAWETEFSDMSTWGHDNDYKKMDPLTTKSREATDAQIDVMAVTAGRDLGQISNAAVRDTAVADIAL